MRSAFIAAAFAAGALAVPFQGEKRDVVTNVKTDVVYVTDVVTVTAGQKAAETPQQYGGGYGGHRKHRHGHHKWGGWGGHTKQPQPEPEPEPTSEPAPAPTSAPAETWSEPAPTYGTTTKTPKPEPSSGGGSPPPSDYAGIAVLHHNLHRKNHSAPDIQWDEGLASTASKIAQSCVYAHNTDEDGGGYGQNIAAGVDAGNISAIITNLFYNGEVGYYDGLYGQDSPSMANFEQWGHFSQIVWKGTTHVGCATQDCGSQGLANVGGNVSPMFTVCNYQSPGNMAGAYGENVGEPLGHATADWNTGL